MKKIIYALVLCTAIACNNPTDEAIKATLAQRHNGENGFTLLSYEFIDTLTYADRLSLISKVDKKKFTAQRNQEFTLFRMNGKKYEQEVMYGALKDASPWCTEIRVITERADNLLADFDNVKTYNYEYQYLVAWYNARFWEFSEHFANAKKYEELKAFIEEHKDIFANTEDIEPIVKNTPISYTVKYDYTTKTPSGEIVNKSDLIQLLPDYTIAQ